MSHSRMSAPLDYWTRVRTAHDPQLAVRFATWYTKLAALPRATRRRLGRSLKRKLALTLATAALLIALTGIPAYAASITVDPGASGINPGDGCSLVEAIINANDNAATYAECTAGSGDDTITLPAAATLTYSTAYGTATALPDITDNLTIEGGNATITRSDAAPEFRILNIQGATFTLNQATISHGDVGGVTNDDGGGILVEGGSATIRYSTISENTAVFGGGIAAYTGSLAIEHTTVSGNNAVEGGGGVATTYDTTLTMVYSTVSGNTAFGGGGILIESDARISNSTITENHAYYGGGILNYSLYSTVYLTNSTVSGNFAESDDADYVAVGGGILNFIGNFGVNRSTISNNSADAYGGGIFNGPYGFGRLAASTVTGSDGGNAVRPIHRKAKTAKSPGAGQTARQKEMLAQLKKRAGKGKRGGPTAPPLRLAPEAPTEAPVGILLVNSTISGNTSNIGAGITNYFIAVVLNTTVTNNQATEYGGGITSAGVLLLERSLISGNSAPQHSEIDGCICYATVTDDYNLFGNSSETNADAFYNLSPGPTDITATSDGTNPTALASILQTTLANNGGPTQTHALVANSPAIDWAPNDECTPLPVEGIDQRNFARNVNGNGGPSTNECDIGAYEYAASTAANVTGLQARVGSAGKVNLRWQSTSETQIAGFNVYRRTGKGQFKPLNRKLLGAKQPGSAGGARYHFKDKSVQPGKVYRYKIQVVYLDNHTEWTSVVKVKR